MRASNHFLEHAHVGPMRASLLFTMLFAALLPVSAYAQGESPKFIDSFSAWNLYTFDNSDGTWCYIASEPTDQTGDYSRRGAAAVLVTKLPGYSDGEDEQVSVQPGYSYLADSKVELAIDNVEYALFTKGEHAWANSSDDDRRLIDAMRRGAQMTVRGTSTKRTYSLDTYSLRGFTAAHNAMRDACPG